MKSGTENSNSLIDPGELLQHISDAVIATDMNFNITSFNKAAERMSGRLAADVIGQIITSVFNYEYKETTQDEALQNLVQNGCWQGKVSFTRKDGERFQILANVKFIYNDEGNRVGVVSVNKDITDLAKTEQKSEQYKRRLNSILNGTTEALFLLDDNCSLLLFNNNASSFLEKFLGKKLIVGADFTTFFPAHRQEPIREGVKRALDGEYCEYEIFYPPSLWALVTYTSLQNEHTAAKEVCVSARDITKRKRAEEEVKMLSLLAKETAHGVMITDADNIITWVNDSFNKTYGYVLDELIGKRPEMLFEGNDTDLHTVEQINDHVTAGKYFSCEIASYNKQRKKIWVRMDMQPIFDDNKKLVKYFVVLTDLTDEVLQKQKEIRKKVEHQKQMNRVILKTQEELSNELGRELHDNINQILTAAKLQIEFAKNNKVLDHKLIQFGINNIDKAINEIRTLSKQLAPPYFTDGDFLQEINILIDSMRLTNIACVDTKAFEQYHLCPELKLHIFRILQEQLKNTVKYAKGTEVKIILENKPDELQLKIEDNGVGFDVSKKKKGIGFTNIRNRVDAFSGSMEIISSPGNGCKLSIKFIKPADH